MQVLQLSNNRLSSYDEGYITLFAYHAPAFLRMDDDDWVMIAHANLYPLDRMATHLSARDYSKAVHLYDFDEAADQARHSECAFHHELCALCCIECADVPKSQQSP